jgi:hypothetical protein
MCMEMGDKPKEAKWAFSSNSRQRKRFWRIFNALLLLVVTADLFVHKHAVLGWDAWLGFFAGYGFVSCVLLLVAARLWAAVTKRDEAYYG